MNRLVKKLAKKNNIELCGITDYNLSEERKSFIIDRRDKGYESGFEEENLKKRFNPKETFPSCKSIIVIALSYNHDVNTNISKLEGKLSKSSWGKDYHNVLYEKMNNLVEDLRDYKDFQYKIHVDTGPLIDRELASLSGIGYFGKNCSIINEKYGSFIFIGYIMTDLEIQVDEEKTNQCGDCRLCIDACPTGALEAPFIVNAKKCISYLTQTREDINEELEIKMGKSLYGCDICQLACPKNRQVKKSDHDEFYPYITDGNMDLIELLDLSNREFKDKYGHMAGSWRGRNILKRNAIIALGNYGDESILELLEKELTRESKIIVKSAEKAIDKIKSNI